MKNKLKWALVLSGGGARGFAHIGILKGLEDAGFPEPSLIVGTSMGAIVGGLYACGMTSSELLQFAIKEFNISDYLDNFFFKLDGPIGQIMQAGKMIANLAGHPGADRGQRVLDLFNRLTNGKKFEDTKIPFRCNAMDLYSGREVIFKSGSVALAMRASMSFPLFFDPLLTDGMCLVDGGLYDNMPVSIARDEGYKNILAVNVNRFILANENEFKSAHQVLYRCMEAFLRNQKEQKASGASLILNVDSDNTPFSFYKKKEFIDLGENAVQTNMEALKKFFRKRKKIFGRNNAKT